MDGSMLSRITAKIEPDRHNLKKKFDGLKGKRVFTNGCFDLLHRGHVDYLCRARDLGDHLIVALNTDDSVKRLKGPGRPVQILEDRMFLMASLECVTLVGCFDEETPEALLSILQPEVHVKGGDYRPDDLPEKRIVESFGGRVEILPFVPGRSTTGLIQKLSG
jgi:rfaE bifunctional protein nucleotidyltransferase chain/domain